VHQDHRHAYLAGAQSVTDRRYNWALIARKYNYLIQKVSATKRQSPKGGLHSQLSQLPPAELRQH
jgi:hypothetical protein